MCHRCDCGFCAYCLADCADDAHRHVANCRHNPRPENVFGDAAQFEDAQRVRRQRMLEEYVGAVDGDVMRAQLVLALAADCADLGLRL